MKIELVGVFTMRGFTVVGLSLHSISYKNKIFSNNQQNSVSEDF